MEVDIKRFIEKGELYGFTSNTNEEQVVSLLGQPDEVEEYLNKGKFLHYENVRFSLTKDRLNSIDIFLFATENEYLIKKDEDDFVLNANTSFASLLCLVNALNVPWEIPYAKSNMDYLLLELSSGVTIYYYYHNEKVERISRLYV